MDMITAVAQDLAERGKLGLTKYGKPLELGVAGDGRDPLAEAYAEALDLAIYLRWAISLRAGSPSAVIHGAAAKALEVFHRFGAEGCTAKELAAALGVKPPAASEAINVLAAGLLIRKRGDKRLGWEIWVEVGAPPRPSPPDPAPVDRAALEPATEEQRERLRAFRNQLGRKPAAE